MAQSPELKSDLAIAIPRLQNAQVTAGAKELAMANGLMERAIQSGNRQEVSQAIDFAHRHGFSARRIAAQHVSTALVQARGGGNISAWVEQYQPSNPQVTADPIPRAAFVPGPPQTGRRGRGFVRQEQHLAAARGPDNLRELADQHAQATARPDVIPEELLNPNPVVGFLQKAVKAVTGNFPGTIIQYEIPDSRQQNAARMTAKLVEDVTAAALSQISAADVAAAAADPGTRHAVAAEWEYIQTSVARETQLIQAQVDRDYGLGGKYENMCQLDVLAAQNAAWE